MKDVRKTYKQDRQPDNETDMNFVKKTRGVLKLFIPYGVQCWFMKRKYGIKTYWDFIPKKDFRLRLEHAALWLLPYGISSKITERKYGDGRMGLEALAEKLGFFDRKWYLENNPDVAELGIDPRNHWFRRGWKEGRNPSERFDTLGYMARYADVRVAAINPLLHYIKNGCREGRDTCAAGPFDTGLDKPTRHDRAVCAKKDKNPFFSVIVASYNYERYVLEALESLWAQTYRNFEIIVVDDGSEDNSRKNICEFISKHGGGDIKISLLTHPDCANRGLAETVRLGITAAKGDYVAFCESDDLWMPDHLAEVVAMINTYADPKVIVNDVDIFGDPVRSFNYRRYRAIRYKSLRRTINRISPSLMREINLILTFSACAVKKESLLKCDFNPVARPASFDWWLWRQICFNEPIYFINKPLTRWRMHESYMSKTQQDEQAQKKTQKMIDDFTRSLDALIRRQHPLSPRAWFMAPLFGKKTPKYRLPIKRRLRMLTERVGGRFRYRQWIRKYAETRILVCLHLYYEKSWDVIREYLKNLDTYNYDLTVTCVEGMISEATLGKIKSFSPNVRILFCENVGYDVGPFVEALKGVDLKSYDIVFKLQSKGIQRPFLYMYGQVFKFSDWFFNLFDGVLGGYAVHEAIHALMSRKYNLAAAENLIVHDPKHKAAFVSEWCGKLNVKYREDYSFVAGTCFAARAVVFKGLQDLNLSSADFAGARPGEFSLAHFLERWMCFSYGGKAKGIPVRHPQYKAEADKCNKTSSCRLLDDDRFRLDYEFFYRVLEPRRITKYEIAIIPLGAITRYWYDGKLYPLSECAPYKLLCGDTAAYDEYCRKNKAISGFDMTIDRFAALQEKMDKFDEKSMPVVVGKRNIIIDGQHRSCILLKRFGPHHHIKVLRIS